MSPRGSQTTINTSKPLQVMNHINASLISKLNPAVPRHYLFAIAGVLWTIAGTILCVRGEIWLEVFSVGTEFALETISIGLAVAGYFFFFMKVVKKNIDRIEQLPERACLFAFTAWHGYIMIALMIVIGFTLRTSSIAMYYLSIPYTTMGGTLLIGSLRFYRQFLAARGR